MLKAIKKFFGLHKEEAPAPQAPYKVEAPASNDQSQVIAGGEASATMAGQFAPSATAEKATEAVVASIAKPAKKTKAPAAKKPRAPRKPKAQK